LPLGTDIRGILRDEGRHDVLFAKMWDVYRHKSDWDLDPLNDAASQRRHGNPEIDVMFPWLRIYCAFSIERCQLKPVGRQKPQEAD
jgi:hypothetical protein